MKNKWEKIDTCFIKCVGVLTSGSIDDLKEIADMFSDNGYLLCLKSTTPPNRIGYDIYKFCKSEEDSNE